MYKYVLSFFAIYCMSSLSRILLSFSNKNYVLPRFWLLVHRLATIFGPIFASDQVKTLPYLETHLWFLIGFLSPLSMLA